MWNPANLPNEGVLAKNYFQQGIRSFLDRQKKKIYIYIMKLYKPVAGLTLQK